MKKCYLKELNYIRDLVEKLCKNMPYNTHHLDHILRVTKMALIFGEELNADMTILETSALLHDIGRFKESENKCHAELSAAFAKDLLQNRKWDEKVIDSICDAIRTHRYNKGIIPGTLEAKILQDADKLDVMGAIGIIRVVSYKPREQLYSLEEPFCDNREPSEEYTLDHFYKKIFKLKDAMHTEPAKRIAEQRHQFLNYFIKELKQELKIEDIPGID